MKKRDMFKLAFTVSIQPAEFFSTAYIENFNKACEILSGLGYHGVELAICDPSQVDPLRIKKSISKYGLKIPAKAQAKVTLEMVFVFAILIQKLGVEQKRD
ncbi:MAG: hypothetical protein FJW63_10185 [Actinobacteria bacterium]|nr:hypothetical protein [Actinomycetota bacterium]